MFYVLQKATDEESARHTGFVFVKNLIGYDLYTHFDRILAKAEMAVLECFPSKLKAFHICAGSGKWVVELILPVMKQIAGRYIRLHMVCHTGSNAELIQELRRYHLVPEGLSNIIGGTITYDHFIQWINEEHLLEEGEFDPSDDEIDGDDDDDDDRRVVPGGGNHHHHNQQHHHHGDGHRHHNSHHSRNHPQKHLRSPSLDRPFMPLTANARTFSGTLP